MVIVEGDGPAGVRRQNDRFFVAFGTGREQREFGSVLGGTAPNGHSDTVTAIFRLGVFVLGKCTIFRDLFLRGLVEGHDERRQIDVRQIPAAGIENGAVFGEVPMVVPSEKERMGTKRKYFLRDARI